ncbi:hypothetical protein OROHE_014991 [Orobanche hederae]
MICLAVIRHEGLYPDEVIPPDEVLQHASYLETRQMRGLLIWVTRRNHPYIQAMMMMRSLRFQSQPVMLVSGVTYRVTDWFVMRIL